MTVKERIKEFITYKEISVRSFEKKCGLSYGYINNMRVSIQPDKITSIAAQYPDLNTGWLLTGEGEMLKSEKKTIIPFTSTDTVPMSVLQFFMESSKTASMQIDELIRQNAVLVDTVRSQAEIMKKTIISPDLDAHQEDDAECAAASGSDLES